MLALQLSFKLKLNFKHSTSNINLCLSVTIQ
jgi:hypothetical protein